MTNSLFEFKERLANDQAVLNSIRKIDSPQMFEDLIFGKSKEWGYNLTQEVIHEELFCSTVNTTFEITRDQIDANPSYTSISSCTDDSNFTAKRASACLSC